MPTITVNGTTLFYELAGDHGEPLVLVHGSWVDHHNWDAVVPGLAGSFRVLAYDRRGHSRSPRAAASYSVHHEVADLAGLIDALGLAPAHVAGNSSGGSIALRLAAARPDLVRSLIVNEPPLLDLLAEHPMLPAIMERIRPLGGLLEAGDHEGAARQFVETVAFGPGMWERIPAAIRETAIRNAPTFLDELRDPEFWSLDLEALRGFSRPVLLMRGAEGAPFAPPIVEKLRAVLPHAETKVFAGAGHEPEVSHPDEYVASVGTFIDTVASRVHATP
jgi:pimeloyl-ACP methyl ester carboxylesterase